MILQAHLAYIHFISILSLIITIVVELVLFEKVMGIREAKKLRRADMIYGLSAVAVITTGLMRIFIQGKGLAYYLDNRYFVIKLFIFLAVGLLSIYPTIVFLRWRKLSDSQQELVLEEKQYKTIKYIIRAEAILVFMIPLFAALMARGVGF